MATLTVQKTIRTGSGLSPALSPADVAGDVFVNTGKEWIEIDNADGTSTDLTIISPRTSDGLEIADRVITIPAGGRRLIGPLPVSVYNDPATNEVSLMYSKITGLTVGIFAVGV
jgi:hypothetical protein